MSIPYNKALIPTDFNFVRILGSIGSSSNPHDYTNYSMIAIVSSAANVYIKCRFGTLLYFQTPNAGGYINCTIFADDENGNSVKFSVINVSQQRIQHWWLVNATLFCVFDYVDGQFGNMMGHMRTSSFN